MAKKCPRLSAPPPEDELKLSSDWHRGMQHPISFKAVLEDKQERFCMVVMDMNCPLSDLIVPEQNRLNLGRGSHRPRPSVTPTFYKNKDFVQIGMHIKMHIKL
jgi:hypothetical protein